MATTDVLVIGGGIVGLVASSELAAAGARVTLVDASRNAGSTANAGSLHVQLQSRILRLYPEQVPRIEAALPFYRKAVDHWEDLERKVGPFGLVRKGGLMLADDEAQLASLERKAERERRRGLDVEILDRAALDRVAPWVAPHVHGAELCRNEGMINPLLANSCMIEEIGRQGVRRETDRIRGIEVGNTGIEAVGERGTYHAGEAIVAAAWGSGPIARSLGTPVPTVPEPLHMNITEACGEGIAHLVQHAEHPLTLKQLKTGQIVIGGGWPAEDRGPDGVPGVRAHSLLGNVSLAARLVPAIRSLEAPSKLGGDEHDRRRRLGHRPPPGRSPGDHGGSRGRRLHARAPRRAHGLRAGAGPPAACGSGAIQPGAFRYDRRLNPRRAGGRGRPDRKAPLARKPEATT